MLRNSSNNLQFIFLMLFVVTFATSDVLSQHNDRHLSEHTLSESPKIPDWMNAEILFTYDLMRNFKGGIKTGNVQLGDVSLVSNFDLEKLDLIPGGSILVYYLGNFGGYLSQNYVGDYQVVNNIETFSTTKLYEFWYQQNLFEDRLSIALGIHDYNRDFDELKLGLFLIHSSFGLGPDISQIPVSNFPTTTLGTRIRLKPTENTYLMYGAYDGKPAKPNQAGTRISYGKDNGIFNAFEGGYMDENVETYKKFSVGAWYSTKQFLDYNNVERNNNFGCYFLTEGRIFSEVLDKQQGLGLFNALGTALSDRNQTNLYVGGGMTYVGIIPNRDEDIFSMGAAYAKNSGGFSKANDLKSHELTYELIYKYKAYRSFTISPDFQYVSNPGMRMDLKDAFVAGVRFELGI